jgi:hypothetical protein
MKISFYASAKNYERKGISRIFFCTDHTVSLLKMVRVLSYIA